MGKLNAQTLEMSRVLGGKDILQYIQVPYIFTIAHNNTGYQLAFVFKARTHRDKRRKQINKYRVY